MTSLRCNSIPHRKLRPAELSSEPPCEKRAGWFRAVYIQAYLGVHVISFLFSKDVNLQRMPSSDFLSLQTNCYIVCDWSALRTSVAGMVTAHRVKNLHCTGKQNARDIILLVTAFCFL
ncbi:hypothetical protein BaRGS_00028629 [Batillaria attramentaria]|uniref:Uncharacterized protein n=1 Tax=Batillaria attramentaria TaxID=370345 RepID=A0ABD0JZW4_9CAEN